MSIIFAPGNDVLALNPFVLLKFHRKLTVNITNLSRGTCDTTTLRVRYENCTIFVHVVVL